MLDKIIDKMFDINDNNHGIIEGLWMCIGGVACVLACNIANTIAHERGYADACKDIEVGLDQAFDQSNEESDS